MERGQGGEGRFRLRWTRLRWILFPVQMSLKLVMPWLCALGILVALGFVYRSDREQQAELVRLRQDNQDLQVRAASQDSGKALAEAEHDELTRLRKDNEDLLRLRNEVRQLRDEKQQMAKQVQTAQAQVQGAQIQAQNAQAQAQVLRQNAAQATANLSPAEAEALRARSGLAQAGTAEQQKANACINNLRQIDGAKNQWALENVKPRGALVGVSDLAPYLRTNSLPPCPAGGIYTLNPVGINPICTIPGHVLPK